MPDDPKRIVEQGYDAIAERYAEWAASFESPAMRWVEKLLAKLDEQSAVLELGCGGGGPLTRAIADRHRLLGVDISAKQIERARDRIPAGSFLQMDATEADFEPNRRRSSAELRRGFGPGAGCWRRWARRGPTTSSRRTGSGRRCSSRRSTSARTSACCWRPGSSWT